jgi:fatty acid desaturase
MLLLVSLFAAAYYLGFAKDVLLYWLIPYATFYQLLNRIRLSTEHFNIDESNSFRTRSVVASFLETLIFTPYNLGYHLEHHLYPSIPFYNLPKLHSLLLNNEAYKNEAIIESSYKDVLKDFIK